MRITDRQIKSCLAGQSGLSGRGGKLEETIHKSKEAFIEREAEHVLSRAEFIRQQGRYIRKRWWVIQAVLLSAMWWILRYAGSSINTQRCMGIVAPLFVVAVIPEFWKNRDAGAMEVECAAYYSLRRIYAARLLLFAVVDLFLVSVFFTVVTCAGMLTVRDLVIQFLLPFNVTCCICFRMLYARWAKSELFALLLCLVWSAVWVRIVISEAVYQRISVPVWVFLVSMSVLYLGYCIRMGQLRCDEMWETA